MARYAPLPNVSIDPRNEAQLVQLAAQTVYEASNRTLNDFSAGNPLAVLLEGQAFAQGEFLYWANQLPAKILIEWIGPFLGAMRRLGTPSVAQLELTISPSNTSTVIPTGTSFSTNPQLTGGVSLAFVSGSELIIPAGESLGKVSVYSKFVGTANNAPAFSITGASNSGTVSYSVINPQPATGGSDVESFQEVQERFFSLIRRRNPVSETDWQNFFIDLYGVGTLTSVQPNRSSAYQYNYRRDYILPNGEVSFFVLGPDGVELTEEQLRLGQNAVNFSVPVENQGHLFPISLSQVQYNLTLEVEANGTFGTNYKESSLNFRNSLYQVLTPGSTFPADVNPTVSDVDAAFYNSIDPSLRFRDPLIVSSSAYNTPNSLGKESATYTQVYNFEPSSDLLSKDDLVVVNNPNPTFFPVESSFTPYSNDKYNQTIYNTLTLKQIKILTAGAYSLGDIVYYDGSSDIDQQGLHVVLENLSINSSSDILSVLASGKISGVKDYRPWIVGNSYVYTVSNLINPDIVQYDYAENEFVPATPSNVPLNMRPGSFAWLVTSNFTLQPATNDVTGAQAEFLLGAPVTPLSLEPETSYSSGTWVYTPQIGSGPNDQIDPYYNYVDITKGAVVKYAFVNNTFTYTPNGKLVSDYFDELASQEIIKEIPVYEGDMGLPIYKYKARFETGQYLQYKVTTNGDPTYYISADFFSPTSTNVQDLINEGLVYDIAPTPSLREQLALEQSYGVSGRLASVTISDPGTLYVNGSYVDVPATSSLMGFNATLNVTVSGGVIVSVSISKPGQNFTKGEVLSLDNSYMGGSGSGSAITVSSLVPSYESQLKPYQRMFTFFAGDRTFFREGSEVQSYTATSAVTPLFEFDIYYENSVFVKSDGLNSYSLGTSDYIPYFNPSYTLTAEDTILSEDGRNFYRVTKAFTPPTTVMNWTGMTEANSTRYEEYAGNLLRYVSSYRCEEPILPQSGKETSSIKLGIAQITIIPKNIGRNNNSYPNLTYIWENTATISESPQLSWYTNSSFEFQPPNYRNGTLAL
jgi:hypothetical protein